VLLVSATSRNSRDELDVAFGQADYFDEERDRCIEWGVPSDRCEACSVESHGICCSDALASFLCESCYLEQTA
jgi:hypothetical protein